MKLLLIGCGNLGKALLKVWSYSNLASQIIVVQPSLSSQESFQTDEKIFFIKNLKEIDASFKPDLTVLAIKPNNLDSFMLESASFLHDQIIVSLLAGVEVKKISSYFLSQQKIVRIMPNIAMRIGQSVNLVYSEPDTLDKADLLMVTQVFNSSGKMVWLTSEGAIDFLTPFSASGPAYFFILAEILANITVDHGIDEEIARELIAQTFLGSAMLTEDNNNFKQLANSVTSKGGITEAALEILHPALSKALSEAIDAAMRRMKEIK